MGCCEEGIQAATHAIELANGDACDTSMALLTRAGLREQIDPHDPRIAEDDARSKEIQDSDEGLGKLIDLFEGLREVAVERREREKGVRR